MNPLTLVKRIQSNNSKEVQLGISEGASWHAKYKNSAYVFAGGIPFELTEGDLLAVFAQVDHVSKYKKKEEEDEDEEQRKREERGVCRAFLKWTTTTLR